MTLPPDLTERQRKAAMILHMALLKPEHLEALKKAQDPNSSGYDINGTAIAIGVDAVRELAPKRPEKTH